MVFRRVLFFEMHDDGVFEIARGQRSLQSAFLILEMGFDDNHGVL